jgi:hypothetical protein
MAKKPKDKKTLVYEAAVCWAKQRIKYRRAEHLGKATSRAALCRRADELSELVLSDR